MPALAHGTDVVIGFNAERYEQLIDCCEHTSDVDVDGIGPAAHEGADTVPSS